MQKQTDGCRMKFFRSLKLQHVARRYIPTENGQFIELQQYR